MKIFSNAYFTFKSIGSFFALTFFAASFSNAQTVYWDADGSGAVGNPPTSGVGGTGVWDTGSARWWNGTSYVTWNSGIADFRGAASTATIAASTTINATGINAIVTTTIAGGSGSILNLTGAAAISNTSTLTISAPITGSNGLTKTGAGFLNLSGNNSGLSGTVYVNAGRVTGSGNANVFGTGTVRVANGASVQLGIAAANNFEISGTGVLQATGNLGALYAGSQTIAGNVTLLGDARLGGGNYTGQITGAYNLELGTDGGTGAATAITLANETNNYTGNTTILTHASAAVNTVVKINVADGAIAYGAGAGDVYIRGGAAGQAILDLNGRNVTLNGLNSAGTASNAIIENNLTGARSLFVGDNNANGNFAGIIRDGSQGIAFRKIGTGTQILSGNNSYTGVTAVGAGTLLINGNQSLAVGNVSIANGATLGGVGTIGGATAISGMLAPGSEGVGLLSFTNGLTLNSASNSIFEIDGLTRGTEFDAINITGALSYNGTLTLDFGYSGSVGQTFNLFSFTSYSGTFSSINFLNDGYAGTFDYASGTLTLTAVPEPASLALFTMGLLFFVIVVRRRQLKRVII